MRIAQQTTACDAYHAHRGAGFAVSARINEMLHETGDLEEKPKRKDRRSAIRIRPVGLTAKQLELIYDLQG